MITDEAARVIVRCDLCKECQTVIVGAIDRVAVYLVLMRRGWTLDGPTDVCEGCSGACSS